MSSDTTERPVNDYDVVIVGAGFAGLYALHRIRALNLRAIVVEAAEGVGGTWYWNAYPGARCDVESYEYSFSFDEDLQQSWRWSERYAKQPEILRYLRHVAQRFDLEKDIRFGTRVESAHFDEADQRWRIGTSAGPLEAQHLIMATGCLSRPNMPDIDGMDRFRGELFHSARWPQAGIELSGKRVGVIGTGSSGVQIIGNIAPEVDALYVFQRTPHWVVPAGNRPISADEDKQIKRNYAALRDKLAGSLLGMGVDGGGGNAIDASPQERKKRYEEAWQLGGPSILLGYDDLLFNLESNATVCEFIADKIRSIVDDPETAEALIPDIDKFPLGARRTVQSDKYYDCFNRDTVELIDTRSDPIVKITETGVELESGRQIDLDVIVFATGFDAMTGALHEIDIRGRDGVTLRDKWENGPQTYLGLVVAGFPNLFTITGPGSPSVLSNMALSIEQHVDFVADLIAWMQQQNIATTEAEEDLEVKWAERVLEVAKPTVFMHAGSWYSGANIKGKPRVFMPYLGGVGTYRGECDEISESGYPGFRFERSGA